MEDSNKYLIHASITADGVVERSDVVGAIFGQTEGLLGESLELRTLQRASKVGRIDVEIESHSGQSTGEVTIATNLDKVETATLAAALETISRIGPCRATIEVTDLEDVRSAKRREIVERARQLLLESFDSSMTSDELVEEVRRRVRVEDITTYEGLPAGPRVATSDAVVIVEGRSDVLALLEAGIKNAVAVEGTDVPTAVAELTQERTVTAFLDGDRGGELILRELAQVADVDYVAFAPKNRSVEDLSRTDVLDALRAKVPHDSIADAADPLDALATQSESTSQHDKPSVTVDSKRSLTATADAAGTRSTEGSLTDSDDDARSHEATSGAATNAGQQPKPVDDEKDGDGLQDSEDTEDGENTEASGNAVSDGSTASDEASTPSDDLTETETSDDDLTGAGASGDDSVESDTSDDEVPETLPGHVEAIIGEASGRVRFLDESYAILDERTADEVDEMLRETTQVPEIVVFDGAISQRTLDLAAQRGVRQFVGAAYGEFTKRPTDVRIRTAEEISGVA